MQKLQWVLLLQSCALHDLGIPTLNCICIDPVSWKLLHAETCANMCSRRVADKGGSTLTCSLWHATPTSRLISKIKTDKLAQYQ